MIINGPIPIRFVHDFVKINHEFIPFHQCSLIQYSFASFSISYSDLLQINFQTSSPPTMPLEGPITNNQHPLISLPKIVYF